MSWNLEQAIHVKDGIQPLPSPYREGEDNYAGTGDRRNNSGIGVSSARMFTHGLNYSSC